MSELRDRALEQFQQRYSAAYAHHLANPDQGRTADEYLHDRQVALGREVSSRVRVYLDTKYWLHFRDHVLGRKTQPGIPELYERIRSLVNAGRVICPLGVYSVAEVQMQADAGTRLRTAHLMDELSSSVILAPESRRIPVEIRRFLNRRVLDPPEDLSRSTSVWTRPSWMVDPYDPGGDDGATPGERLASRKAAIDAAWGTTATDIVAQAPGALPMNAFSSYAAPILNIDKPTPEPITGPFARVFLRELLVALDMYRHAIEEEMDRFLVAHAGPDLDWRRRRDARVRQIGVELIYGAFADKRSGIDQDLPFFRIIPGIMAVYRNDRQRRFKPNDLFDFYHAASALPYSQLYLTETSMRHLLTSRPLAFDTLYGTSVVADPAEAMARIQELC